VIAMRGFFPAAMNSEGRAAEGIVSRPRHKPLKGVLILLKDRARSYPAI
jgi:hypothetical protein